MPALSHANAAATMDVVLAIVVAVAVVVLAIVVAVSVVVVEVLLVALVFPCLRQGPPRQDRPEIGGVPDGPTRLDGLLSSCRREDGRGQMRSGSWDGSEGQRRDRLWQQHYITQTKLRLKQTKQNINKLEYCKWSRYSIVLNSH